jgi:hypothetical protein
MGSEKICDSAFGEQSHVGQHQHQEIYHEFQGLVIEVLFN